MCTVVLLLRPGADWPVLIAANRDEMLDRAWDPPAAHWPERPGIVGGRDCLAGGTWMALNRHGVVATVLNRQGSLGPRADKESRGELPLIALAEPTAAAAAAAIGALDAGRWRRFNMVLADGVDAFFLRGLGEGHPHVERLAPGLAMVTAHNPNDQDSPRVARHLPRFAAASPPQPPAEWASWTAILADRSGPPESQLTIAPRGGFGTVCAALLALRPDGAPVWLFAPGPADQAAFAFVAPPGGPAGANG